VITTWGLLYPFLRVFPEAFADADTDSFAGENAVGFRSGERRSDRLESKHFGTAVVPTFEGSQMIRSVVHTGTIRRQLAASGVLLLIAFYAQLTFAGPAVAAPFTGGVSPTIVSNLADLNGDGVVNGSDDANAFYGDTHIIDGALDCNGWLLPNAGSAGDGVISALDDCVLIGYDGTPTGVTILVVNGAFQVADGPLPIVFNALDPDNPDVSDSDFAWSTISGRVDSSGDETITADDCHLGLIGLADDAGLGDPTVGVNILGNDLANSNPCGFANPPADAHDGLVDLNGDGNITAADSCPRCFFGHGVATGRAQVATPSSSACPGHGTDPRNQVVGTSGADVLTGTVGADVICGLGGSDTLNGLGGKDLLLGGGGADVLRGGLAADRLVGSSGNDRLLGGPHRDRLLGGPGRDRLFGGPGGDRMLGGPGNDRLDGGRGNDFGVGGPGADTFVRCETRRR
jgi:Ca2+-binding RTX toxin-like protein